MRTIVPMGGNRIIAVLVVLAAVVIGFDSTKAESSSDHLYANGELLPDDFLLSSNGKYKLIYQWDGNLVLYDENDIPMWASSTSASSPGRAVMQTDGNFVVYDNSSASLWASGTSGNSGAYLVVQNDGNVVVYDSYSNPIWSTDTATGRWVWNSGDLSCTWSPAATGDNECGPDWMPDPPEIEDEEDPAFSEVEEDEQGFSGVSEQDDSPEAYDSQSGLPSCNSYTKNGNVGYIAVQTHPTDGTLAWGAYMYNPIYNFGFWSAQVYSNSVLRDSKNQLYPPHGSVAPVHAPVGSVIVINVTHLYWALFVEWVWEGWGGREGSWWGGWRPVFRYGPQIARGTLSCLKTR